MELPFIFSPKTIAPSTVTLTVVRELLNRGINIVGIQAAAIVDFEGDRWYAPRYGASSVNQRPIIKKVDGNAAAIGCRFYRSTTSTTDTSYISFMTLSSGSISLRTRDANDSEVNLFSSVLGINEIIPCSPLSSAPFFELVVTATTLKVFINNAEVFSYALGAPVTIIDVRAAIGSWTGHIQQLIKDIYFSETRLGEGSVRSLSITTVASNTGTVTGAANAAEALAAFSDTAKYVTYGEAEKTLLNHSGITDNPAAIKILQVTALGKKIGTALTIERILLSTASENVIGSPVVSVLNTGHSVSLTKDPHDDAAWTKAKINSMTFGVGSE